MRSRASHAERPAAGDERSRAGRQVRPCEVAGADAGATKVRQLEPAPRVLRGEVGEVEIEDVTDDDVSGEVRRELPGELPERGAATSIDRVMPCSQLAPSSPSPGTDTRLVHSPSR